MADTPVRALFLLLVQALAVSPAAFSYIAIRGEGDGSDRQLGSPNAGHQEKKGAATSTWKLREPAPRNTAQWIHAREILGYVSFHTSCVLLSGRAILRTQIELRLLASILSENVGHSTPLRGATMKCLVGGSVSAAIPLGVAGCDESFPRLAVTELHIAIRHIRIIQVQLMIQVDPHANVTSYAVCLLRVRSFAILLETLWNAVLTSRPIFAPELRQSNLASAPVHYPPAPAIFCLGRPCVQRRDRAPIPIC